MFEDDGKALYLDSGPVTDSREGGPEDSVLELVKLEDDLGSTRGDAVGRPLPIHLGQETGCLSGGLLPADGGLDSYSLF